MTRYKSIQMHSQGEGNSRIWTVQGMLALTDVASKSAVITPSAKRSSIAIPANFHGDPGLRIPLNSNSSRKYTYVFQYMLAYAAIC